MLERGIIEFTYGVCEAVLNKNEHVEISDKWEGVKMNQ